MTKKEFKRSPTVAGENVCADRDRPTAVPQRKPRGCDWLTRRWRVLHNLLLDGLDRSERIQSCSVINPFQCSSCKRPQKVSIYLHFLSSSPLPPSHIFLSLLTAEMTSISLMSFHRAQIAARLVSSAHLGSSSRLPFLPSHRHAFMSALSRPSTSAPPVPHSPTLGETPPVVVPPSGKAPSPKDLSADAASPQTAARPPPVPKAERLRPKIRAAKAAITVVSPLKLLSTWPGSDSLWYL